MTTNHAEKTAARARAERDGVRYTTALARERVLRHPRVDSHPGPDGLLRHDLAWGGRGYEILESYVSLLDLLPEAWSLRSGGNGYALLSRESPFEGTPDAAVGLVTRDEWGVAVREAEWEGAPPPRAEDLLDDVWTVPLDYRLDDAEFVYTGVLDYVFERAHERPVDHFDPPFGEVVPAGLSSAVVVVRNRGDGALVRELAAVLASLPSASTSPA